MVYRLTWIGIAAGLLVALLRMENLLRPASKGPAWQLVLVAALLLGCVITWVARSYRVRPAGVVAANLAGMALATIRIAAPESAFLGILPTWSTFGEVWRELEFAMDLIRFGTAPIVPVAGLILILTWVFWVIGVLIVWGLQAGRPAVAVVPGIVLYLQLATMDRSPNSAWSIIGYLALIVATLAAIAHDERTVGSGRVRDRERRFLKGGSAGAPIVIATLVLVLGVGATTWVDSRTPNAGVLNWRTTGFGNGLFGGVSFNHFVGIQQSLVNLSDTPVFTADVRGPLEPDSLYWKLIALEAFDGQNWYPRPAPSSRPPETGQWELADQRFLGQTTEITATVTIDRLQQTYLPAPYSPVALASNFDILTESYRVRPDGAVKFDARTFDGLQYQVTSQVPNPNLGVLASNNGALSPLFAQAARDGAFEPRTEQAPDNRTFEAREELLDTSELDPEDARVLEGFARLLTENAETNFERAVIMESFFRDPDNFTYNTQVAAGSSATNIVDWLLDEESTNYREGYCEQFAASMAIMARTLNIPARVILGFAPGDPAADGIVTVKESDAHAWVELWFNTQGWVRFDPTPRSAADNPPLSATLGFNPTKVVVQEETLEELDTAPGTVEIDPAQINLEELLARLNAEQPVDTGPRPEVDFSAPAGFPWRWVVVAAALVLAALPPSIRAIRKRRRLEQLRRGDVTAAWQEIVDQLEDLGDPVPASATPMEAAAMVSPTMTALAEAYQAQIYGPGDRVPKSLVTRAEASYGLTHRHLQGSYTPPKHLWKWLRIGSLRRR